MWDDLSSLGVTKYKITAIAQRSDSRPQIQNVCQLMPSRDQRTDYKLARRTRQSFPSIGLRPMAVASRSLENGPAGKIDLLP